MHFKFYKIILPIMKFKVVNSNYWSVDKMPPVSPYKFIESSEILMLVYVYIY